ncbi:MAG: geranylgeranylglyceryl/heptaprenylglyceryl phosphate synthase [Flavobacteriaceae bacterium]
MSTIYNNILASVTNNKKLLAVLIDPDKMDLDKVPTFINKVNRSKISYVLVGGSTVNDNTTGVLVLEIKKHTKLPVVLFPGDVSQINDHADALLFLSLISGRNPEYLIGKHVDAVSKLRETKLEIIPTGYMLIENGKETSVQKATNTLPMPRHKQTQEKYEEQKLFYMVQ